MALTDEEAVARVLEGDSAAFEVIMRRYNQRLFRTARAILRSEAEAEDAVQQAYISAFEHLPQFHGDAQLATWLTRITIRAALGRLRKQRRRSEVDLTPPRIPTGDGDPEHQAATRELSAIVEAAIDALPEMYRLVFMMREVQQLSTAEAADCLDVSEDVVKIRLFRAKAMLREALAEHIDARAGDAFVFMGPRCDRVVAGVLAALPRLLH